MKLQLTKTAQQQLAKLDFEIDYHECSEYAQLLLDAMLYVENAYVNNKFKNLDNWCLRTGKGEFQDDHKMRVKENIGKMLIEDIITIVE